MAPKRRSSIAATASSPGRGKGAVKAIVSPIDAGAKAKAKVAPKVASKPVAKAEVKAAAKAKVKAAAKASVKATATAAAKPVPKAKVKATSKAAPKVLSKAKVTATARSATAKAAAAKASALPADVRRSVGSLLVPQLGPETPLESVAQLRSGLNRLALLAQAPQSVPLSPHSTSSESTSKVHRVQAALLKKSPLTRAATGGVAPFFFPLQPEVTTRKTTKKIILKGSLEKISRPDFRRIARRAGARRMATLMYAEARLALKEFLVNVVGDSTVFVEWGKRKVTTTKDVLLSLRRRGRILYGFDM